MNQNTPTANLYKRNLHNFSLIFLIQLFITKLGSLKSANFVQNGTESALIFYIIFFLIKETRRGFSVSLKRVRSKNFSISINVRRNTIRDVFNKSGTKLVPGTFLGPFDILPTNNGILKKRIFFHARLLLFAFLIYLQFGLDS